jgi:hypothetical protein
MSFCIGNILLSLTRELVSMFKGLCPIEPKLVGISGYELKFHVAAKVVCQKLHVVKAKTVLLPFVVKGGGMPAASFRKILLLLSVHDPLIVDRYVDLLL